MSLKPTSIIREELGINNGGIVHKFFTNECYRRMDKYVPIKSGNLRRVSFATTDTIVYNSPYAHYQYIGKLYIDPSTGSSWAKKDATKIATSKDLNYHTPGTGSYWDKRMLSVEKEQIINAVSKLMKAGFR